MAEVGSLEYLTGAECASRPLRVPPPSIASRSGKTLPISAGLPLERISIELSRHCNLECIYCYTQASRHDPGGLSDAELGAIVAEAAELGARLVSIVAGGEPMLRRSMTLAGQSLIDRANALGCYCYLYTNCTLIRKEHAEFFFERDVSIVGKLNSLKEDVQDELTGVRGSYRLIRRGIDALLNAGFASTKPTRLALESIICRQNYEEIPELWRYLRSSNIIPEFEIPTLHGRAIEHLNDIAFDAAEAPGKYQALFTELARIDREEYGYVWEPHPPFPAASCRLFENNCYINANGSVQPCAGVDCALGQLKVGQFVESGISLAAVVELPAFRAMREVRQRLEAPCRDCELNSECYGCRGAAFQATGNMFAADPICWNKQKAPLLRTQQCTLPCTR